MLPESGTVSIRPASDVTKYALSTLLLFYSFLCLGSLAFAQESDNDLLAQLLGDWNGEAVQTPVGPVPYDIQFVQEDKHCVGGVANTGLSKHYWSFCEKAEGLKLVFRSDFRGNDQSIFLHLVSREKNTWFFRADSHPFMDVILQYREESVTIKIVHYQKLHVEIELKRSV